MIAWKKEDNALILTIEKNITAENADQTYNEIAGICSEQPSGRVIVDLSDVSEMNSSGLRVLLKLSKTQNNNVILINVNNQVYKILEAAGFTSLIYVEK